MSDPHPELARLLSGLGGGPADDAPWLVIADWLEEHGEAQRAELTRLSRRPRRAAAEPRIRELLNGGVRPCVSEITNSIGMRLALIPAGAFMMGSPVDEPGRKDGEDRHEVTLAWPCLN